jgi:hypothetical protein
MVRYWLSFLVAWSCLACGATTPRVSTPVTRLPKPDEPAPAQAAADRVVLCARTVDVRDEVHCIKELSASEQRQRSWSRRLTYRQGHVVRVEDINGRGAPFGGELFDDICKDRDYTYKDGKPIRSSCRDVRGVVRRVYEISADGLTQHTLDAWKRPSSSPGTRWVSVRRAFDDKGRVASETYLDRQGRTVPNRDGVCRVDYERDSRGVILHERYYDDLGEPMLDVAHVHHVASLPSEWGWPLENRYFDSQDQPVSNRHGYHSMRFVYNEFGQSIQASRFGLSDEPVIDTQIGASFWSAKRNEFGEPIQNEYFDTDGEPTINTWHYFLNRESYDAGGRRTERSFFDIDGEPTPVRGGNFTWRWNYDDTGVLIGTDFLDEAGRPMLISTTHAGRRFAYDERFNLVREQTIGTDGQPANVRGYATAVNEYDEFDQPIRSETFDAAGILVDSHDGYARATSRYASDGSLTERRYFDARGGEIARARLAAVRIDFTSEARIAELPAGVRRSLERRYRVAVRTRAEAQERAVLAREALSRGRPAEVVIAHFGDREKSGSSRASSYEVETLEKLPEPLREASLRLAENEVSGIVEGRDAFWVLRRDPDF